MLTEFHTIAVSFKEVQIERLPDYGIAYGCEQELQDKLYQIKDQFNLSECYYLSTCNRIVYFFITPDTVEKSFIRSFFREGVNIEPVVHKSGQEAVEYFFQIASSLHSMVVGEREILKQIKVAYEQQASWGITGDNIRLLVQHTIRSAKQVYQQTRISEKPISVVSLAVQELLRHKLKPTAKILMVGAGSTNALVIKHLTKKGFRNFSVYNRTKESADKLVSGFNGHSGSLDDLKQHSEAFECVIACTGAQEPTVTSKNMQGLVQDRIDRIIWLDLGVPGDIDRSMLAGTDATLIDVRTLQTMASGNMKLRTSEVTKARGILANALQDFEELLYERKIEKAFQAIPQQIKSVKEKALSEVFSKDLANVDSEAQLLIGKMMDYMEKKCIGIPMKAAKKAAL